MKPKMKEMNNCPSKTCSQAEIPVVKITVPDLNQDLDELQEAGKCYENFVTTLKNDGKHSSHFEGPYVPRPYIFKMANGFSNQISSRFSNQHARSPPQWLLIDHTLAVIWCLFSPKKEHRPGIVELHWALSFLKGVKNELGHHEPDVKMCIDVMEKRLLALYSQMQEENTNPLEIESHEDYVQLSQFSLASLKPPLSPIQEEASRQNLEVTKTQIFRPGLNLERTVPMSATIHSVLRSQSQSVYQLFKAGSATINKPSEETIALARPSALVEDLNLGTNTSKDEVLEFLKQWRSEQISRIEGEMTRLRSIEAFLQNVNMVIPEEKEKA